MKRNNLFIIFYIFCISAALTMFLRTDTYAKSSKKISVDIPEYYECCTFNVKCEEDGSYEVVLISPEDEKEEKTTYNFQKVDSQTFTCTVTKVNIGEWIIKLTDKNASSVDDITKVKVNVTSSKSPQTQIVDNITVAKDINGLKVYLKNDSVVAEWTDDSCGNVNVKVINLDTAEVLGDEQVAEKYYECELAPTVKNIIVTVVPSVSSNIEGASNSYTFKVNNHPDAVVDYPNITATNLDYITLDITLNEEYSILAYDNNAVILDEKNVPAGFYSLTLPVQDDGVNVYKVFIVDKDGNMRSTDANIIKDTYAPELVLDYEYNGMTTDQPSFTINGTVKDFSYLTINKDDVEVTTDGRFTYDCLLHMGDNDINMYAEDDAGNHVDYNIVITRVNAGEKVTAIAQDDPEGSATEPSGDQPTKKSANPVIIAAIVIIGVFVIIKIKKKREEEYEDDDEEETDEDSNENEEVENNNTTNEPDYTEEESSSDEDSEDNEDDEDY